MKLNEKQVKQIVKVYVAAEVMNTLLEQVEGTPIFKGATKNFTNNAIAHFGKLSRDFTNNTDSEHRKAYSEITFKIMQLLNEIEVS